MNLRVALATLWLLAICILSVVPVQKDGEVSAILNLGHVGVYAILTILWGWAFEDKGRWISASVASIPLTELLQLFTPWREATLMDVANNALGVILGLLASLLMAKVTQARQSTEEEASVPS